LTRTAPARILDLDVRIAARPTRHTEAIHPSPCAAFWWRDAAYWRLLLVGVLGYRAFEGMAWIDAFLNAAMLLGGMGPVPPELHTQSGKVFAGLFALYSGLVVLAAASILIAPVFHRIIHRFHLEDESKRRMK